MAHWLRRLVGRAVRAARRAADALSGPLPSPPVDPTRQRYIERKGFIITDLIVAALPAAERFTILDGGALGALSDPRWQVFAGRTRIYGFEPNAEAVETLNATVRERGLDHRYVAGALWSAPGTLTFHANKAGGGGSFYPQNVDLTDRWKFENTREKFYARDMFYPTGTESWTMTSVDHWARGLAEPLDIDFIKLNVQGAELEILRGAESVIDRTIGVMVEMSFVESYKQRPFFADIDRHLRDRQLSFFDFIGHHCVGRAASPITAQHLPGLYPLYGQLIEGHGVYFRDPIDMVARGLSIDHLSGLKLLKLVAFAETFGQIEYAFELLLWLGALLEQRGDGAGASLARDIAARAEQLYLKYLA